MKHTSFVHETVLFYFVMADTGPPYWWRIDIRTLLYKRRRKSEPSSHQGPANALAAYWSLAAIVTGPEMSVLDARSGRVRGHGGTDR